MNVLLAVACLAVVPFLGGAQTPAYEGRPAFSENVPVSYHVWHEGGTWHVRFTSLGRARTFSGSVASEGGKIQRFVKIDRSEAMTNLYPRRRQMLTVAVAGSPNDFPRQGARNLSSSSIKLTDPMEITFNSRVDDSVDGFDFGVDEGVTGLRFYLRVDGREKPDFVLIGKKSGKADALPLIFPMQ
jgi:hypothetical protein